MLEQGRELVGHLIAGFCKGMQALQRTQQMNRFSLTTRLAIPMFRYWT